MSSLVSQPTGTTRPNTFFDSYKPTNIFYGNTLQKLITSDRIGTTSKLTAPKDFYIKPYLPYKIPIGGLGQSNATQRVRYH